MTVIHYKIDDCGFLDPEQACGLVLQKHSTDSPLDLIFDHVWEMHDESSLMDWIQKFGAVLELLRNHRPQWRLFLVINSWWGPWKTDLEQLPLNGVLCIDYFLYRTVKEITVNHRSAACNRWPGGDRFLFLTGDPARPHRTRLLSKIVDAGLVDRCEWSLHLPDVDQDIWLARIHQYLPEISKSEMVAFLNKYRRNPDQITADQTDGIFAYEGIPYDVALFSETGFSLVSETSFRSTQHPWITEKTWKAVINHHPFIIAGDTGVLDRLSAMGFVTFDKFLDINYDGIDCQEQRLDAIVSDVRHWNSSISKFDIPVRVQYNREQLQKRYLDCCERIHQFKTMHQLDDEVVLLYRTPELYSRSDRQQAKEELAFTKFYNDIKDESWPVCRTQQDFAQLPEEILVECRRVFGYIKDTPL